MVYPLLNTWRCKRCKNIWKAGEDPDQYAANEPPYPDTSLKIRKRTDPLETRLEKKLNEYLTRTGGKFCITTLTWQAGDISEELFNHYIKRCVNNQTLAEIKDRYGRIWYTRPG